MEAHIIYVWEDVTTLNMIQFSLSQVRRENKMEKKCPKCEGGRLMEVTDIVSEIEGHFFIIKGKRCTSCGEEFINEKEGQKMIEVAKRLGIWGEQLKLHRKLSQSARGTVLRIPTDIEKSMKLKGDEEVLISKIGKNKLLIEIES